MQTKSYTLGPITYGYSLQARKWIFKAGTSEFLCACLGKEVADKVANILNGSVKRAKSTTELVVDNLARANIRKALTIKNEEVE